MAALDRRVLPLIETLGASGADWLGFELTDGIRRGRVIEEPADALERARNRVREGLFGSAPPLEDSAGIPLPMEPIVGDQQIDWVINYLDTRLEDTIAMLVGALEGLGELVNEGSRSEGSPGAGTTASEIKLVLQDDESSPTVDLSKAMEALSAIQTLKSALNSWGTAVRDGQL